jgi:hypothetical protein
LERPAGTACSTTEYEAAASLAIRRRGQILSAERQGFPIAVARPRRAAVRSEQRVHHEHRSRLWGQWGKLADMDAADGAVASTVQAGEECQDPAEVVSVVALPDLKDMVVELASAVDRLARAGSREWLTTVASASSAA